MLKLEQKLKKLVCYLRCMKNFKHNYLSQHDESQKHQLVIISLKDKTTRPEKLAKSGQAK